MTSAGRKHWVLRYKKPNGKWGWHGLGTYSDVSAKYAREKARAALKLNTDGVDPITHKAALKAAQAVAEANTFKVAADLWLEKKINDGRAEPPLKGINGALKNDILPPLGINLSITSPAAIAPTCRRVSRNVGRITLRKGTGVGEPDICAGHR